MDQTEEEMTAHQTFQIISERYSASIVQASPSGLVFYVQHLGVIFYFGDVFVEKATNNISKHFRKTHKPFNNTTDPNIDVSALAGLRIDNVVISFKCIPSPAVPCKPVLAGT